MFRAYSDLLIWFRTRLLLNKNSRSVRADVRKINKTMSGSIRTPAQLDQANVLYRDTYIRFDSLTNTHPRYLPSYYQALLDKVEKLLANFDEYLANEQVSPEFQQQCLVEMKHLAPASDSSSDDIVVFEMRSDLSFNADCVLLYQPPVICKRERKNATESIYVRLVVQTPRWVHAVMQVNLRSMVLPAYSHYLHPDAPDTLGIDDPLLVPSSDVLGHATQLWLDAPSDGVYTNFSAALTAAQLLV